MPVVDSVQSNPMSKLSTKPYTRCNTGNIPEFPVFGVYPLEISLSFFIGQNVLIKAGRFASKEGVIASSIDGKYLVRIGDEFELVPTTEIEPVVTQTSYFDDKPSSPLSPSSPISESSIPLKSKPRRRGPKVNLVGRFVRIEGGRYKGEAGYVTRGGNGYYSIKFSADSANAHETVMKRGADLTPVSKPDDFVEGPDFQKAIAEATAELKKRCAFPTKTSKFCG